MGAIELIKPDSRVQRELLAKVDELLDSARENRELLGRTYVEIGAALCLVEEQKAWMLADHSFEAYLKRCEARFGKSRTQLFAYKSCARNLLPYLPAEKLCEIGITKAQSLAGFVKKSGKKPTPELLEAASNPKIGIEEFRASVAEELHEKPEKGIWFQPSGFFCTKEEQEELERAYELAASTDPPITEGVSEWRRSKEIQQRLAMEYLATYGSGKEM